MLRTALLAVALCAWCGANPTSPTSPAPPPAPAAPAAVAAAAAAVAPAADTTPAPLAGEAEGALAAASAPGDVVVAPLVETVEAQPAPAGPPPRDLAAEERDNVQLTCLLNQTVRQCQWAWQRLGDVDGQPVPVKTFDPLGKDKNDCSVRFEAVVLDQEGVWTCGAVPEDGTGLVRVLSIRLTVHPLVRFETNVTAVEVRAHEPTELPCRTARPVEQCHWEWRAAGGALADAEPEPSALSFAPPPPGTDCSLRQAARPELEGRWQCSARAHRDAPFVAAAPVHLKVLEGITFVELSGEIKVNEGEPVALRCVVSMAVASCQWLWRPLHEADTAPVAVKNFTPAYDQRRDCSVRFGTVLKEQQGLWSCAVRVAPGSHFVEAPPTSVQLLPPVKLRFLEIPEDKRVALGHSTVLPCVATSSVKDCLWTWRSEDDKDGKGIVVKQFSAFGNHSRDCSIHFKKVQDAQDGFWGCTIRSGSLDAPLEAESPLAKLTTFISEPIEFTELSQDIHVPNGSHLYLRCVSSSALQECQWTRTALNNTNNSSKMVKTFAAHGNGSRDCSMHIDEAAEEHEGIWTCGARKEGESFMTVAPPARVTLLKPESVMVALWAAPGEKVTLACRLSSPQPTATCYWQHLPHVVVSENNHTERHFVQQNNATGVCTLLMDPKTEDLGQWRCLFTMATKNGEWELAAATLILLTTNSITDKTMDWIVGVLAGLVLLLTIVIIVILVCKRKSSNSSKSKDGLGNPTLHADTEKKNPSRYTEAPSKINFQFGEGSLTTGSTPSQQTSDSHHIYEPVDRYLSPTTNKSIYENVK
ncbi:hypothetical protein R5R35_008258 [Gryllus longicercus]|uniref:Ig-like domain-containing protein n=1 Tax=Gryllus longicercus TaxID=2509291 RepID=A0AAN9W237_9ORTH